MVTDSETDFLYLADSLPTRYPEFYHRFEKTLASCGVDFALLPNTRDVWAVDYMPVQVEANRFVRFTYNPSYLQTKKLLKTVSDVDRICNEIAIGTCKSDIVLDGGNVVKSTRRIIMTDRVFVDNPAYERKRLITALHELLQVDKLYFVPEQPGDFTGHADGMVRFVDENTVLINDYRQEDQRFRRAFEIAIHNTGLDYIKIPYNVYGNRSHDQANGDYVNYLHMKNLVIVPAFGLAEDEVALRQLENVFTGQTVVPMDCNEIANDGGILNCITWNIKKREHE